MVAGASLIKGGSLSVRLGASGETKEIHISAVGDVIKLDTEMQTILNGQGEEKMLSPKTAQLFLTMKLLQEVSATLGLEVHADRLEFVVRQKQVIFATAAH